LCGEALQVRIRTHQSLSEVWRVPCACRDAQRTYFRRPLDIDKARISALEADLAKLISGGALNRPGETTVQLTEEWV
jgi:hypothetical protein